MEIVLLENIKNLGKIGDTVIVKRGHGRNFLIKYGKALKASKENIDLVNKKNYKFSKMAKENNELYGSIKPKEISKNLENIDKIEIKPSQIDLGKEINKIGKYEAKINLHAEIQALIHIEVVKQEEEN